MSLRILDFVKFKIHNYLKTKLSIMVQMNFYKIIQQKNSLIILIALNNAMQLKQGR
jgi:hypothetical protein